ncbi:hypothetical protein ES703_24011 [subsurface metagenome]
MVNLWKVDNVDEIPNHSRINMSTTKKMRVSG